jgi:hypothetical protein
VAVAVGVAVGGGGVTDGVAEGVAVGVAVGVGLGVGVGVGPAATLTTPVMPRMQFAGFLYIEAESQLTLCIFDVRRRYCLGSSEKRKQNQFCRRLGEPKSAKRKVR